MKGQKGFTLIELLIVVAILGALAVIVVPNASKFIGAGSVEAANIEATTVQTAVYAYMTDNGLSDMDGPVKPEDVGVVGKVGEFLTGGIEATYTITDGRITNGVPTAGGKWAALEWSTPGVPGGEWVKS